MPYSENKLDRKISEIIKSKDFKYFLDIGPGNGKYGKLISKIKKGAFIEAIEIETDYIKKFRLNEIYQNIFLGDVIKIIDKKPNYHTELVILGDVIEHFKKSNGVDLINYLVYRSKLILVIFPSKYIQYSWKNHDYEVHRSVWAENDFKNYDYSIYKKDFMNLVVIKGFLGDKFAIVSPETKKFLKSHKPL